MLRPRRKSPRTADRRTSLASSRRRRPLLGPEPLESRRMLSVFQMRCDEMGNCDLSSALEPRNGGRSASFTDAVSVARRMAFAPSRSSSVSTRRVIRARSATEAGPTIAATRAVGVLRSLTQSPAAGAAATGCRESLAQAVVVPANAAARSGAAESAERSCRHPARSRLSAAIRSQVETSLVVVTRRSCDARVVWPSLPAVTAR